MLYTYSSTIWRCVTYVYMLHNANLKKNIKTKISVYHKTYSRTLIWNVTKDDNAGKNDEIMVLKNV